MTKEEFLNTYCELDNKYYALLAEKWNFLHQYIEEIEAYLVSKDVTKECKVLVVDNDNNEIEAVYHGAFEYQPHVMGLLFMKNVSDEMGLIPVSTIKSFKVGDTTYDYAEIMSLFV